MDFVAVHKHAKKEQGQYPALLTEQAWFIIWDNTPNFPCGTKTVYGPGKIAPPSRSGSQSQRKIRFILPAHGASHIIMLSIVL